MSTFPDFTTIDLGEAHSAGAGSREPWDTAEGIAVQSQYRASDAEGIDFLGSVPGAAPFVRGPYPTMFLQRPWTIRQYAGFSTAEDSNAFYRRNLAAG